MGVENGVTGKRVQSPHVSCCSGHKSRRGGSRLGLSRSQSCAALSCSVWGIPGAPAGPAPSAAALRSL